MDRVRTSQSRHNVTGTLPLGQREKISRYFQSSVGHDGQHKVSEAPADEDSESGNSLFLTQADVTLPVAGRSGGQRHDNTRAKPTFPTDLEERDDRSLSSSSDEGQWRRKKCSLPIFNFPFLESQKRRPRRSPFPDQNKDLHMYMIGGFFKCLGELRQSGERGPALESSLPTVDVDGEHISPLSEEDGERSEDEDIKVVGIKEFVALSTKRSKQNWCNQLKKQHRGKGTNTGNPPQTETCYNKQIMPSVSSDANSSGIGKSSCKVLAQKGTAKQATVDANSLATTDTRKTKRCLARGDGNVSFLQKANEGQKTCNGNDAGVLKSQKSLRHATQKGSEASQPVTGREGDGQEVDGNVESEVRVENDGKKKRTKRSGADVEHLQPSTAAEPPNDCVNIQKKKKKKRKKDLGIVVTEERKAKGTLNRSLDLPAVSMEQLGESENCLDIVATSQETSGLSFVKRKKDKKKQQSLSNDAPDKGKEVVDVSCYLDDPVTTAKDSRATPKKKKTIFEEINDSFSTKKKKKKKKSEGVSGDKYEDTQAQSDYSASTRKKEKKSSFPVADVEENKVPTDSKLGAASAPHVGGPEELEVMASDQEELLNGVTEQKKKKKKKKSEGVSRDKYEDTQAQSDYSASTRKKEKKKKKSSFPVADVEKNEVPTDSELGAASAPCVGGPKELEVMASDQEELLNGVTEQKKKKKRKMSVVQDRVEEDHEQNRQEPGKTHRKRKKKRAGSESEGLDGAPDAGFPPLDEASGLKKKKRRCDVIEQDPPTHNEATTEAPTSDERDLASLETPGNQALDTRNKKKKKIKNGGGESAESERREKKKRQERNEKSTVAETSDIMKNKHGKLKRKLFNPNDEFFTGY